VVAVEDVVAAGEAMEEAVMVDTEVETKEDMVEETREVITRVATVVATKVVMATREDTTKEATVVATTREAMTRARVVVTASLRAGEAAMARARHSSPGASRARPTTLAPMIRVTVVAQPGPRQAMVSRGLPPMEVEVKEVMEVAKEDMVVETKEDMEVPADIKFDRPLPSYLGSEAK